MLDKLISLLAPHRCIGCQQIGNVLCKACSVGSLLPAPSRCYRCHKATKQFQVCPACRSSVGLSHVWVASMYDGLSKDLLQILKFQRARAGARDIAGCLDNILPLLGKETIVCHIPTASSRIRQRGYDQSELIAKELSKKRGYIYSPLLIRLTSSRQLGATRKARFKQARSAFSVRSVPEGAHVLIIDDVTTSGATIESASRLLRQAGAKTVDACIFAQAID